MTEHDPPTVHAPHRGGPLPGCGKPATLARRCADSAAERGVYPRRRQMFDASTNPEGPAAPVTVGMCFRRLTFTEDRAPGATRADCVTPRSRRPHVQKSFTRGAPAHGVTQRRRHTAPCPLLTFRQRTI